jgi:site-specific DNA recombinase
MQNRLDSFVAFSAAAYRRMSDRYEKQQDTLTQEVSILQKAKTESVGKRTDLKEYMELVKKYTDIQSLTPEIMKAFISRIYLYEATVKSDGRKHRKIRIIYNFIDTT